MNYNRGFFIVIFGFLLCYEIFIERMPFNKIIVQYKVEMYCMIFKFKFLFTVLCICLCFQSKLSLLVFWEVSVVAFNPLSCRAASLAHRIVWDCTIKKNKWDA